MSLEVSTSIAVALIVGLVVTMFIAPPTPQWVAIDFTLTCVVAYAVMFFGVYGWII